MAQAGDAANENGTGTALVVIASRPDGRVRARPIPEASFVSQLIAERDRLPVQRERRQAPVGIALGAYRAGAAITIRRMPAGYRKTLVA